jgi:hypothetical protein
MNQKVEGITMKATGKKRGLPKGRTNNPHGRPRKLGKQQIQIAVRLDSETHDALDILTEKWGCGIADAIRRSIREVAKLT